MELIQNLWEKENKDCWYNIGIKILVMLIMLMWLKRYNCYIINIQDRPLNQKKEKIKDYKITDKFVGSGNKGYYIKDWKVMSGHGSERVSTMFRDIVH